MFHLQRLLFDNFRSAVELIHGLFELSSNQRTSMASTTSEDGNAKWTSRSLLAVKEHVSAPANSFFFYCLQSIVGYPISLLTPKIAPPCPFKSLRGPAPGHLEVYRG